MNKKILFTLILCIPIITTISLLSSYRAVKTSDITNLESATKAGDIQKVNEYLKSTITKEGLEASIKICDEQIKELSKKESETKWKESKPTESGMALEVVNPMWEHLKESLRSYQNIKSTLQDALKTAN